MLMKLPSAHAAQAPALRELRGIKAELRRSQPVFALAGFDAVRPAIFVEPKL